MQLAMVQDDLFPLDKLDPVCSDRGLYFGDGVYEVMRSYNGRLFAFEEHMQRFGQSLAAIGIDNVDLAQVRGRVRRAFEESKIANAKIYWHITRGSGPRDHVGSPDLKPNFLLTISELNDAATAKLKETGVKVSTFPDWRWKRCDIKSLNLLANVLAERDAASKGCFEAILYDEQSKITEGASSAFFTIFDGKIRTTPLSHNILPSITRIFVLEAAQSCGVQVVQQSYTVQEASNALEMFLAVTTKDIVPVVEFEGKTIGNGRPGEITKKLIAAFKSNIDWHCS
jgi:D-alanine transaminase